MAAKHRPILRILALIAIAAVLFVLSASRPGRSPEGCPANCALPVARNPGPLRVASLNMLHGHPEFEDLEARLDILAGEIKALDPDILLLQEVPWRWNLGNAAARLAERTGMNHLYLRANGNRWTIFFEEGEAILSRYPLRQASAHELQPQASFFEHRVVLHAVAATRLGEIDLYVVHLTDGAEAINHAQAQDLITYVSASASGPAIVAGDFNAREDEPQLANLSGIWVDSYRAAHADDPGFTCCIDDLHNGPDEPLEKRIDYLFLAPGEAVELEVISSGHIFNAPLQTASGWQWPSDHVGLMVELVSMPRR